MTIYCDFLKTISKCWSDHVQLLSIIIITARAISLSFDDQLRTLMSTLMRKCRQIASEWIVSVENAIISANSESEEVQLLKIKLFEVCCFSILTYYVDEQNFNLIMDTDVDIETWFSSMSRIYNHKVLLSTNKNSFCQNLFNRVVLCMLNIEKHLYSVINRNEKKQGLTMFLKKHWPDFNEGSISKVASI